MSISSATPNFATAGNGSFRIGNGTGTRLPNGTYYVLAREKLLHDQRSDKRVCRAARSGVVVHTDST